MKISIKLILLVCWTFGLGIAGIALFKFGISLNDLHEGFKNIILDFGIWGPIIYIFIYSFRSIIFFPASLLTALAGLMFGPLIAILSTVVGENISANISFVIGRYFGSGILKRIGSNNRLRPLMECQIRENGFLSVLTMRLIYLPFDLVGYGSGACGIKQKDFALATVIGTLPGLVTFVFLGSAVTDPRYFVLVVLFLIFGWAMAKFLRKRTPQLALNSSTTDLPRSI